MRRCLDMHIHFEMAVTVKLISISLILFSDYIICMSHLIRLQISWAMFYLILRQPLGNKVHHCVGIRYS